MRTEKFINFYFFNLYLKGLTSCFRIIVGVGGGLYFLIVIQIFDIWYTWEQPFWALIWWITTANSNMQKYLQNFQKLNLFSRKTDNLQILVKGICAKIVAKFLRINCSICFLLFKVFQRVTKSLNPMTGIKPGVDSCMERTPSKVLTISTQC